MRPDAQLKGGLLATNFDAKTPDGASAWRSSPNEIGAIDHVLDVFRPANAAWKAELHAPAKHTLFYSESLVKLSLEN
jgi:hypothetical protein